MANSPYVGGCRTEVFPTRSMSWKGYENFKRFKILVASRLLKWAGHGQSITRTDLVAYRTELLVMLWDVVHSQRVVKHGELPTRYLRVATTLKATSHEFLRHLTSLLRHAYEYP